MLRHAELVERERQRVVPPVLPEGGADFSDVSQEQLNHIALLMNFRLRQTFGWKTPSEAMEIEIAAFKSRVALEF